MATETITTSRTYVANQAGQWISLTALSGSSAVAVYSPPSGASQTFNVTPPGPVNIGSIPDGGRVVVTMIAGSVVVDTNIDDAGFADSTGQAVVGPDGYQRRSTAAKLRAAYEAEQGVTQRLGAPWVLSRGNIPSADIPIISRVASPSADDAASTRVIQPFGSATPDLTSQSVRTLGRTWIFGINPMIQGGDSSTFGSLVRLPGGIAQYATTANLGIDSVTGYGANQGHNELSIVLDGDRVYFKSNNGARFRVYVNDALVVNADLTTDAAGSVLYDSADNTHRITGGGNDWLKIRFAASGRRAISLVRSQGAAGGMPAEIVLRPTASIFPRSADPIRWLHLGESFSTGSGASTAFSGLDQFMVQAFGRNIDFINIGNGASSLVNGQYSASQLLTSGVLSNAAPTTGIRPTLRYQFELCGRSVWSGRGADVVSLLVGHNDSGIFPTHVALATECLQQIRAAYPGALVIVASSNSSPGINTGSPSAAIVSERNWLAAAAATGCLAIPLQESPLGQFHRGSGRVGATTGDGNSDFYTTTDNTHPSDAGHRAYGEFIAARIYDACVGLGIS